MTQRLRALQGISAVTLILLIMLCVFWEGWLAPARPGGTWLTLKGVPLLFALPGVLAGRRYTMQWAALLIWLYFIEGATRAWTDRGGSQAAAGAEVVLALAFFAAAAAYARFTRAASRD